MCLALCFLALGIFTTEGEKNNDNMRNVTTPAQNEVRNSASEESEVKHRRQKSGRDESPQVVSENGAVN